MATRCSSGTSPSLLWLRTARLNGRQSTVKPRAWETSTSQREARHVQGHSGSKKKMTSVMAGDYPCSGRVKRSPGWAVAPSRRAGGGGLQPLQDRAHHLLPLLQRAGVFHVVGAGDLVAQVPQRHV